VLYAPIILAQTNYNDRLIKMKDRACEQGAEQFSIDAEKIGSLIPMIISNTTPNSKERIDAIAAISKKKDYLENMHFKISKEFINRNREDIEKGDRSAADPGLYEYYWTVFLYTIPLAFHIAEKEPGKSQLTYRRMIEQECILTGMKR
jgi:hypothetical protein